MEQSSSPLLEVEDLRVTFNSANGPLRAVDGVDLTVDPGETVALVGESGCGKTMTALAIMGLVPREVDREVTGSIRLEGRDMTKLSGRELRELRGSGISMIFQEPISSLNPVFTVGEQIAMVIRAHSSSVTRAQARDRTVELLDKVGIPDPATRLDDYPHQWSGGMCQRGMIAMAIANGPRLVIADEPTTALDVTVQALVLRVLREAQRATGAALLMITHDLGVVAEMADRVMMMYAGRIVEEAPVDRLFADPRHPYTRGLLASLPRVDSSDALISIPGQPPRLHAPPSGCSFHPRCALAADRSRCSQRAPELLSLGPGRRSACHFESELAQGRPRSERGSGVSPDKPAAQTPATQTPAAQTPAAQTPAAQTPVTQDPVAEPVLAVENLAVHFPIRSKLLGRTVNHVKAVDGLSFELAAGETLGVVGESGCGKTTTANAVVRLLAPTAGSIRLQGSDLTRLSGAELRRLRRGIQMVFQDPQASLNPKLTIGSSIGEPLRIHGYSRSESRDRVLDLLGKVGLDRSHAQRYPHQFSGGQLQRVGIARALALEPRVMVLDEPVSALDVSIRAQILNLLAELQRSLGVAYLLISHDLSVVRHVADRVAVMYLGRIVESGPTETVFGSPRHPYTRALLDAIPVPDPTARRSRRIVLTGDVADPASPPSGCHFRTRCWKVDDLCHEATPALLTGDDQDHHCACHFPRADEPVGTVAG